MVQGCPVALHSRYRQVEFLAKEQKELGYLRDRCLTGINTPSIMPTEEPGPFGAVQGSSGALEVRNCNPHNSLRKDCLSDKSLDNFRA